VAAARGGRELVLFAGDGKGGFAAPQIIDLDGRVTALAAGKFGTDRAFDSLLVGLEGSRKAFSVVRFAGTHEGLAISAEFDFDAPVSSIALGNLGDPDPDAAVLAGGRVMLIHSSSMQAEKLALPVSARAMALRSFIHDRDPRNQIALLTADGSLDIAAHKSFDPRPFTTEEIRAMRKPVVTGRPNPLPMRMSSAEPWKIVETISTTAGSGAAAPAPLLVATRISGTAADDVMLLDGRRMIVISHPNLPARHDDVSSRRDFVAALRRQTRGGAGSPREHRRTPRSPGAQRGADRAVGDDAAARSDLRREYHERLRVPGCMRGGDAWPVQPSRSGHRSQCRRGPRYDHGPGRNLHPHAREFHVDHGRECRFHR